MTDLEFQNMSDEVASLGLSVVRINKNTNPKIWKIKGKSNVFKNHFVCDSNGELLNHFDCKELRLATNAEIDAGRRLEVCGG